MKTETRGHSLVVIKKEITKYFPWYKSVYAFIACVYKISLIGPFERVSSAIAALADDNSGLFECQFNML